MVDNMSDYYPSVTPSIIHPSIHQTGSKVSLTWEEDGQGSTQTLKDIQVGPPGHHAAVLSDGGKERSTNAFFKPHFILYQCMLYTICIVLEFDDQLLIAARYREPRILKQTIWLGTTMIRAQTPLPPPTAPTSDYWRSCC